MRMHIGVVALGSAIAFGACRAEPAQSARAAGALPGTYDFAAAGTAFSLPWAFQAALTLRDDSRFELSVSVEVKDDHEQNTDSGTYRVEGDRLVLMTGAGDREPARLRIRGDSLVAELEGWGTERLLKAIGVPRPVFVRRG